MYRCPECKSTDLEVDIVTRAVLIQDEDGPETLTDEASCGDHEWDNNSMMYCTECNHSGTAETFETEDDEGDEDDEED